MIWLTVMMAVVAALYGTAGQAGGGGFIAVMTFASFPPDRIRILSFFLNVVAAAYATTHAHQTKRVDWRLLFSVLLTSMPAAFLGGMVGLQGAIYYIVSGSTMLAMAILMAIRVEPTGTGQIRSEAAALIGAIAGLSSGATGVGGGLVLSSALILAGRVSPKKVAALSPPFILINSAAAFTGMLASGHRLPVAAVPFGVAALAGSVAGVAIGHRWMTETAIKRTLAVFLLGGAVQMLLRA